MPIIDSGSSSAGKANVDSNYNLNVNLPTTSSQAGYSTVQFENDPGLITGVRYLRSPYISEDYRMSIGLDSTLAMYNFTSTTQNTGDWKHAFTTMTMTQSSGFLNINPALATVSGNYASLSSWKYFTLQGDGGLHIEITGAITSMPPANQIFECGLYNPTAGVVPADGVFFRLTSAGLVGVISYSGTETVTSVIAATLPLNTNGKYKILISQREVSFWINDSLGAELEVPTGNAVPYLTLNLPLTLMLRNSGTVTGGTTVKIGTSHITQQDLATNKNWAEQMAIQGNAYQGQEGDTQGKNSIWVNNTAPTAVALTNTTAAFVGLGGIGAILPTLTANNDGILFSYQNPVGSVTQPPKTLVIRGITLKGVVSVILAGGPVIYTWAIAFGHTNVSLATTESASFATGTTKAPRIVPLGIGSFPATSAVGTLGQFQPIQFSAPIVVNPGEYFQIIARNIGTVTTTGAITVIAGIDHYYE